MKRFIYLSNCLFNNSLFIGLFEEKKTNFYMEVNASVTGASPYRSSPLKYVCLSSKVVCFYDVGVNDIKQNINSYRPYSLVQSEI